MLFFFFFRSLFIVDRHYPSRTELKLLGGLEPAGGTDGEAIMGMKANGGKHDDDDGTRNTHDGRRPATQSGNANMNE